MAHWTDIKLSVLGCTLEPCPQRTLFTNFTIRAVIVTFTLEHAKKWCLHN